MTWVVVLFTNSPCVADPEQGPCVCIVVGPFTNSADAETYAGRQPDWSRPHVMPLLAPLAEIGP
jgi:hypothetical protein